MAKLKYDVTDVEEFEPYAGPTPKRGIYDVVVRSVEFGPSSNDNDMFTFMVVIDSKKKEQKPFNGCPLWQTWVIGDLSEEYQKRNLKALIKALGLKEKGSLDTDAIIKKATDMRLRCIVKNETRDDELVARANGLLPFKAGEEAAEDGEVEEPDEEEAEAEEGDEEESSGDEEESEEDEFDSMTRAQLRKHIKDNEMDITVKKAMSDDDIREAIRAASASDEDEEEEDGEEESSVEEDIAELDRTGLKSYIKENELDVKVTKSMSDDDIRKAILAAWPDEEEGEEDSGDEPPF